MRKLSRTWLGPNFSEAARRLWAVLPDVRNAQHALSVRIEVSSAHLTHLLYGDQKAGREVALRIQDRLGIAPELWDQPPLEPFVLPAVRTATEARAKLAALEASTEGP